MSAREFGRFLWTSVSFRAAALHVAARDVSARRAEGVGSAADGHPDRLDATRYGARNEGRGQAGADRPAGARERGLGWITNKIHSEAGRDYVRYAGYGFLGYSALNFISVWVMFFRGRVRRIRATVATA